MARTGRSVNTVEAKNRFNQLVAEVNETREPVIVEKRGKPVAVVLDYQSYQKEAVAKKGEPDEGLWRALSSFHKTMKKKYPSGTGDSAEILRQVRQERSLS